MKKYLKSIFFAALLTAACLLTGLKASYADEGFVIDGSVLTAYTDTETIVTVPSGVTKIGDRAFAGNKTLSSVTLPGSVTEIAAAAFFDCTALSSVQLGNSLNTIGSFAFCGCRKIESISLPDSVTVIGDDAFAGCSLSSIKLPASLKVIGNEAFLNNKELDKITLPEGFETLGDSAFEGCGNVTDIYIPKTVTHIGVAFPFYEGRLNVYYGGSKDDWGREDIAQSALVWGEEISNLTIKNAKMHYNACRIYPFTDVSGDSWYTQHVYYVYEKGAMTGLNETQFGPESFLERAMVPMIFYKIEKMPAISVTEKPFKDVGLGRWFTSCVAWAKAEKIVNGYNPDYFGPEDRIIRQDFIKILYSYAVYKGYDVSAAEGKYREVDDWKEVSNYAVPYVNWGYANGFIGNGSLLKPKDDITRAEAATVLSRFIRKYGI